MIASMVRSLSGFFFFPFGLPRCLASCVVWLCLLRDEREQFFCPTVTFLATKMNVLVVVDLRSN
jgi:hypothetical protein